MNTPGVSLFHGSESIKINTSVERAEEEEALEEQRRRNEELGNILQGAFDDLDEEDTTVDSTTNFHSDLQDNQHNFNNNNHAYLQRNATDEREKAHAEEMQQLKMLLESRTNELGSIKALANEEFKKRDELQKRLAIAQAELDRALATKKNSHELLVECKEKCSNLENTIAKLRSEKKALEAENNAQLGKLETTQMMLADVQRKYDMVERDLNKQSNRNAELRTKQIEERHRAEIEMMQQQMDQLANKLEKKTLELEHMNTRYHALQSSHEVMLIEKGGRINDLNHALSEAQKKCEELMYKQDYFQENVRLQKLVASLQERLEFTTAELDGMDSVLQQYNLEDTPRLLSQTQGRLVGSTPLDTVDRVGNLKSELYRALANVKSKREEVRKLQQKLEEANIEIRAMKSEENKSLVQISMLKDDKTRLENRVKLLEEESLEKHGKTLSGSIKQVYNEELQLLREQKAQLEQQHKELLEKCESHEAERKVLDVQLKNVEVDLEELKQEHESMKRNYEQIHKENQELRTSIATDADNVRLELEKHKFLLKDSQAECDRLKNLYIEISNTKDALTYEIERIRNTDSVKELQEQREKVANLQRALQLTEVKSSELSKILETEKLCHERDLSALKEKYEKEKANELKSAKDTLNNCTKCIDYMAEITKYEIQNLKLTNLNDVTKKEIDELTKELQSCKELIAELRERLKICEHQEQLIKELKRKAQKFEEYIKNHSSASEKSTNTTPPRTKNACSDKSIETTPELRKLEVGRIEMRIRDEMAKIFATEIKRYQRELYQNEEKCAYLQRDLQRTATELKTRHTEVELLKQAILAEREKMTEIMDQKDSDCRTIVEKQNVILQKCRKELRTQHQKITELAKELSERQTQIEAERQSMKAVMSQWEHQRQISDTIESEWKTKLDELQQIYESAMASWQTKYNSAKRTAANYKRYSEDKEAHMLKEYERIKSEYDTALAKIEVRMKKVMERKTLELKDTAVSAANDVDLSNDKENKACN